MLNENSDIPNKNGMRCDVVNALKELRNTGIALAGSVVLRYDYHVA